MGRKKSGAEVDAILSQNIGKKSQQKAPVKPATEKKPLPPTMALFLTLEERIKSVVTSEMLEVFSDDLADLKSHLFDVVESGDHDKVTGENKQLSEELEGIREERDNAVDELTQTIDAVVEFFSLVRQGQTPTDAGRIATLTRTLDDRVVESLMVESGYAIH